MADSNLLAIPLIQVNTFTGTNEDWVDSIKFLVETGVAIENLPQLDLRGIEFEMEVRRSVADHEVILTASTKDGGLAVGAPPDFGYLLINIDVSKMITQQPGDYVADIVGTDRETVRRIVDINLTIVQGVTR